MRTCPHCKVSLPEGPRFCINCGSWLHQPPVFPDAPPAVPLGDCQAPPLYPTVQLQQKIAPKALSVPSSRSPQELYAWGSGYLNGNGLPKNTEESVGFLGLATNQDSLADQVELLQFIGCCHQCISCLCMAGSTR